MAQFLRSHTCGELREEHIGQSVTLSGWVHRHRDLGGLIFVDLRDRFGVTQLIFDPQTHPIAHEKAYKLRQEYVISIRGSVARRKDVNLALATGHIEVHIEELHILSVSEVPPFSLADEKGDFSEELRLQYRYLDLRRSDISKKMILRHQAMMSVRQFLDSKGFLEISTPILGKSTPEGARDYLVPSRIYPGSFYALPQSPQIFKQLLMIGGMDRYFQIATCFRDEDLRADRQPEFTQIDMEMSFVTQEQLFPLVEGLVGDLFKQCKGVDIAQPIKRMTHAQCLESYGCDKPDLRFGMKLIRLDGVVKNSSCSIFLEQIHKEGVVKGFTIKNGATFSRKEIEGYSAFVSQFGIKGLSWFKCQEEGLSSPLAKFFTIDQQKDFLERMDLVPGDLAFVIADQLPKVNQALDHLRRKVAKDLGLIDKNRHELLWVTDFPLFSWNEEEGKLESEHHPFTSPNFEDYHLIDTDPLKMRSSSYDLVLNGYEVASGSQRIHDSALQQRIFERLHLTPEELKAKFGFFIDALKYGTPPHIGIALGFDRLMMILAETDNIRDVVAFPKTQKASDLMMSAPAIVSEKQLNELGIQVRKI